MISLASGREKRFTKTEWSWIFYDWANSIYATNIMAAIFPTIFVSIAGEAGDIWWGYGTSIATFMVALLAPVLGAVADYKGMKKKLFTVFMLLGVVFTFAIAMVMNDWRLMLVGYILSRIGFSGSCLFYDSFLTDVTTDEKMDKVSSWGYAMGYIGGSTIPFVISIAILLVMGYSNPFAQKFSILITSIWWLVFSIPFLKNVEQTHYIERTGETSVAQIFRNIGRTARDIFRRKGLFLFVLAYFFYIDGVGTIISISTAYGTVLGLGSVGMILALLVTQIVAMPCSILFANLAEKITARKALIGAIIIYTLICVVGFYMGFSLEPHQDAYESALKAEYSEPLADLADENAIALRDDLAKLFTGGDAEARELRTGDGTIDLDGGAEEQVLEVTVRGVSRRLELELDGGRRGAADSSSAADHALHGQFLTDGIAGLFLVHNLGLVRFDGTRPDGRALDDGPDGSAGHDDFTGKHGFCIENRHIDFLLCLLVSIRTRREPGLRSRAGTAGRESECRGS